MSAHIVRIPNLQGKFPGRDRNGGSPEHSVGIFSFYLPQCLRR
ncbi:hypothetical protein HMPREF3038_01535 [Akkermansia sp. KLE1797]|nr:hypothetical protein HMPREF3038_01535 [Akkermansia sp. KLE1797]KXU54023.1 hypothetical protein HMPREF3039_01688 [Akkermansia sp. KLE1798]KZA05507.1 hypothetical protein HMPREF1326_00682 [Akkermansia sp. KLE1605]